MTDSNTILTGMVSNASLMVVRVLILVLNAAAASEWDSVPWGMFSAVQVLKAAVMQDDGRWGVGGTRERKWTVEYLGTGVAHGPHIANTVWESPGVCCQPDARHARGVLPGNEAGD